LCGRQDLDSIINPLCLSDPPQSDRSIGFGALS
jgi:hypothetical protein